MCESTDAPLPAPPARARLLNLRMVQAAASRGDAPVAAPPLSCGRAGPLPPDLRRHAHLHRRGLCVVPSLASSSLAPCRTPLSVWWRRPGRMRARGTLRLRQRWALRALLPAGCASIYCCSRALPALHADARGDVCGVARRRRLELVALLHGRPPRGGPAHGLPHRACLP